MKLTDKQAKVFELIKRGAVIKHYLTPSGHVRNSYEVVNRKKTVRKTDNRTLTKLLAMDLITLDSSEAGLDSLTSIYKLKDK